MAEKIKYLNRSHYLVCNTKKRFANIFISESSSLVHRLQQRVPRDCTPPNRFCTPHLNKTALPRKCLFYISLHEKKCHTWLASLWASLWTLKFQINLHSSSSCTWHAIFPKTHLKTDQTMTNMSPLFNCSPLRTTAKENINRNTCG